VRRLDIPVVEKFPNRNQQRVIGAGKNIASKERVNDQAADERVEQNFDRMLVKAGQDFEPARGVMDLVENAPKKLRFVPVAMPPIKNKGRKNVNRDRSAPGPKIFSQVKQRPMIQPAVPSHARQLGDSKLDGVN
jgi:hypothetical protein